MEITPKSTLELDFTGIELTEDCMQCLKSTLKLNTLAKAMTFVPCNAAHTNRLVG